MKAAEYTDNLQFDSRSTQLLLRTDSDADIRLFNDRRAARLSRLCRVSGIHGVIRRCPFCPFLWDRVHRHCTRSGSPKRKAIPMSRHRNKFGDAIPVAGDDS